MGWRAVSVAWRPIPLAIRARSVPEGGETPANRGRGRSYRQRSKSAADPSLCRSSCSEGCIERFPGLHCQHGRAAVEGDGELVEEDGPAEHDGERCPPHGDEANVRWPGDPPSGVVGAVQAEFDLGEGDLDGLATGRTTSRPRRSRLSATYG